MRHAVRVVCRPEVGVGFGLAGLSRIEARDAASATVSLIDLLKSPRVGVVLIQQEYFSALPESVKRELGRRTLPLVVPFPGPARAGRAEGAGSHIIEILRQAIGYRVRLR